MEHDRNFSWINIKIDRALHAQFSFYLKMNRLKMKGVINELIVDYLRGQNADYPAYVSDYAGGAEAVEAGEAGEEGEEE